MQRRREFQVDEIHPAIFNQPPDWLILGTYMAMKSAGSLRWMSQQPGRTDRILLLSEPVNFHRHAKTWRQHYRTHYSSHNKHIYVAGDCNDTLHRGFVCVFVCQKPHQLSVSKEFI